MPAKDESYEQEACLGRVRMKRTKKLCYLVKWVGWDKVGDITSEPPNNVMVPKVEDPLLDQASKTFQEQLSNLLQAYLQKAKAGIPARTDGATATSADAPSTDEVGEQTSKDSKARSPAKKAKEDGKLPRKRQPSTVPQPPSKVPKTSAVAVDEHCTLALRELKPDGGKCADSKAPYIVVSGGTFSVRQERQFILLDKRTNEVQQMGNLTALFVTIKKADMNPGIGWTIHPNLRTSTAHPDTTILNASVDHMSQHVGFGWFFHEMSGISLGGCRYEHPQHTFTRFSQGDTIGIVIDTAASKGYCVRNGHAVFTVAFTTCLSHPMQFALHLCERDEVTLCDPPAALDTFVVEGLPEIQPLGNDSDLERSNSAASLDKTQATAVAGPSAPTLSAHGTQQPS